MKGGTVDWGYLATRPDAFGSAGYDLLGKQRILLIPCASSAGCQVTCEYLGMFLTGKVMHSYDCKLSCQAFRGFWQCICTVGDEPTDRPTGPSGPGRPQHHHQQLQQQQALPPVGRGRGAVMPAWMTGGPAAPGSMNHRYGYSLHMFQLGSSLADYVIKSIIECSVCQRAFTRAWCIHAAHWCCRGI